VKSAYEKLLETEEGRIALAEEHAIAAVGDLFAILLDKSSMSRKDLAERVGVTPGRITQLLDGDANMTLSTVARLLYGFGHILEVSSRHIDDFTVPRIWQVPLSPDWATKYPETHTIMFRSVCQDSTGISSFVQTGTFES
jgi:transcriptional regulator with XRE-family HTH domain